MKFFGLLLSVVLSTQSFAIGPAYKRAIQERTQQELNRTDFILKCQNAGYGFVVYENQDQELSIFVSLYSSYDNPENWIGTFSKQSLQRQGLSKQILLQFAGEKLTRSRMSSKESSILVEMKSVNGMRVVEMPELTLTMIFRNDMCE